MKTGPSTAISSGSGGDTSGGGNGAGGGDGGNGDTGRAGRGVKRSHRALVDPYEAALQDDDRDTYWAPEPDTRLDPYVVTPEFRALEARPTVPAGPSSARPTPLANSTRPTPKKRTHVDYPAGRPLLWQTGFSVEEYVAHHAGNRLDTYRFSRLCVVVGKELKITFQAGSKQVTTDSRYDCWDSRWRHFGNHVHRWETPDGLDILYYRTHEEGDYFTRHAPFLQRILDSEKPIERWFDLDPTEHFVKAVPRQASQ